MQCCKTVYLLHIILLAASLSAVYAEKWISMQPSKLTWILNFFLTDRDVIQYKYCLPSCTKTYCIAKINVITWIHITCSTSVNVMWYECSVLIHFILIISLLELTCLNTHHFNYHLLYRTAWHKSTLRFF